MLTQFAFWQFFLSVFVALKIERCSGLLCHKCDSAILPDCAMSLNESSLRFEQCKSALACAMTIVDGVTYRGCSTNTPRGPEYYKTCADDLCNKDVYPPGRLKCYQCGGKNCVSAPTGKPRPCRIFQEEDYYYLDAIDEVDAYRGCWSDETRQPNILATYCKINGCNDSPAVTKLTCSKCDSSDGRGCKMDLFEMNSASCNITNTTTCSVQQLLGHESESCFLYHNLDHIVRGCTFDSGTLSLDVKRFVTCDTELCNKKCLTKQKCIICDSTKEERCKSQPSSLKASTCPSAEASSCNTCELTDGTVQRGCGIPSVAADVHCNHCQGEGCNKLPLTKCYKCTSDESPNCAQWANPNIIGLENCEVAGADCVTATLMNGKTLRGCESSQLKCDGTQSSCVACNGNLCNEGVFPVMRLQCYQCDGREDCSDVTDVRNVQPCAQYDSDDACFEFVSPRGTMVRGCKSDSVMFYECLLAGSACRVCVGSGCNMMAAESVAQLRCHQCSRDNASCSWEQDVSQLVTCQKYVKFLSMETCYVRRYADGSTSRGCTLNDEGHSEGDFLMKTCAEEGCNNAATVVQKCFKCRGKITEENDCKNGVSMESVFCGNGSVRFELRGCYTQVEGEFIERGCGLALHADEFARCANSENCQYCNGSECNTGNIFKVTISRNASTRKQHTLIALFLILIHYL